MRDMTQHVASPHDHDDHDDFGGLGRDMPMLLGRRRLLGFAAAAGAGLLLAACGGDDNGSSATTSGSASDSTSGSTSGSSDTTTAATSGSGSLEEIPEETAGPYPGDGSNGPNILTESGVVRQDIRSSIGSASGVAEGVPLTINLTVVEADTGAAIPGAAVYLWHCDRDGNYSMYSDAVADENYLRGVQEADASGNLSFTSIFPACYSGRWPHIHFEVYSSLDEATAAGDQVATSQIALPEAQCTEVYATDGYDASVRNMSQVSLSSDNVFSDGWESQTPTISGDASSGYTIALTVPV